MLNLFLQVLLVKLLTLPQLTLKRKQRAVLLSLFVLIVIPVFSELRIFYGSHRQPVSVQIHVYLILDFQILFTGKMLQMMCKFVMKGFSEFTPPFAFGSIFTENRCE